MEECYTFLKLYRWHQIAQRIMYPMCVRVFEYVCEVGVSPLNYSSKTIIWLELPFSTKKDLKRSSSNWVTDT